MTFVHGHRRRVCFRSLFFSHILKTNMARQRLLLVTESDTRDKPRIGCFHSWTHMNQLDAHDASASNAGWMCMSHTLGWLGVREMRPARDSLPRTSKRSRFGHPESFCFLFRLTMGIIFLVFMLPGSALKDFQDELVCNGGIW